MQDLKVIGVENGALLMASDEGTRYRVEVDESFQAQLRRARPAEAGADRKAPPREIQAHIRAGMSAEDVAAVTGATLEYIRRFEGPVVAEREFVVESALNVAVHVAGDTDPLDGTTFGSVIRARLADGGAADERWASWKDAETGWIVKLTFTAETVEHDARWSFDPRKQALSPLNAEAISLSQQGEVPASLIPRLRAVPADAEGAGSHRFDSGAFSVTTDDDGPRIEAINYGRPAEPAAMNQTADLLEALRRRRGERDTLVHDEPADDGGRAAHPSTGTIRLVEVPLDGLAPSDLGGDDVAPARSEDWSDDGAPAEPEPFDLDERDGGDATAEIPGHRRPGTVSAFPSALSDAAPPRPADAGGVVPPGAKPARRGRASMPSWDEIVFGARTDDD